jgi:hypothetical protein
MENPSGMELTLEMRARRYRKVMDKAVEGCPLQVVIPVTANSIPFGGSCRRQVQDAINYGAGKGYRLHDAQGAKLRKVGHLIFERDRPRAEG